MKSQILEQTPDRRTHSHQSKANWKAIVADYQKPNARRASWQLVNTIVPYLALWALMFLLFPYRGG